VLNPAALASALKLTSKSPFSKGSAWSGSVINLESIANEEIVLDARLDALIQRCDACVGLVQFEVSYFQNRIVFALTAVSAIFLPASFFVTFVFPEDTVKLSQSSFWVAVFSGFYLSNLGPNTMPSVY
jgi:hypothetical protein